MTKIELEAGKYTITSERGTVKALRYGEPWRDLTGDKLVGALLSRVEELQILEARLSDELEARLAERQRHYVLTMDDSGANWREFSSAGDRVAHLAQKDDTLDDFYALDVELPSGDIDFYTPSVGEFALEDLRESHPDHPYLKELDEDEPT